MESPIILNNSKYCNYKQEDYKNGKPLLANIVNLSGNKNKITYSKEFADGYAKKRILEPGLSYSIVNYTLNTDLEYRTEPSAKFVIKLYFYQLTFTDYAYCKIENTVIESQEKSYSIALITTSQSNKCIFFKKGTAVKGLTVLIDEDWLNANIREFALHKHEFTKPSGCIIDFISAKQRKILADIFDKAEESQAPELFTKSRVLRLTEQFLTNTVNRGFAAIPEFTNQKDFQALLKVEHLLLQKYSEQFPSIETLAKTALMSESKLKKLFKKAFGLAPYEFYQKNRMHKAKEMLTARKQTVTQVGAFLGYQNLSNFSTAFKKEFDVLPSQVHELN
jgi:AraC-like DNA-binding protein